MTKPGGISGQAWRSLVILYLLCDSIGVTLGKDLQDEGNNGYPLRSYPLLECEGDCDHDTDCLGSLRCFQRDQLERVPGCAGIGTFAYDYCYDSTRGPSSATTDLLPPLPKGAAVTYQPGALTVRENGLSLSAGLTSRVLARAGFTVKLDTGGFSVDSFHFDPDFGATFQQDQTGGWVYTSNSEVSRLDGGGVGALYFDAQGRLVDYKKLLTRSNNNCGGGSSWWKTWLSCEEVDLGQVWEVDPWGQTPPRKTLLGALGPNVGLNGPWSYGLRYESVTYDRRDVNNPCFFTTVDDGEGPLVRFRPDPLQVQESNDSGNFSELLHSRGDYRHDFLKLNRNEGTFEWTTDFRAASESASQYYQNSEGIDFLDGKIYMITKSAHLLWVFDLDRKTFTVNSTISGSFNNQPDQITRTKGNRDNMIYFCEDGGSECGIHGRDAAGRFFTVLQSESVSLDRETTGLAFSPDNQYMYVGYQGPGIVLEIRRTDGYPFGGPTLPVQYHAS